MKFSMLQQDLLCRATRFFTTQKNFSHRKMMAGVKKNRRRGVGFSGFGGFARMSQAPCEAPARHLVAAARVAGPVVAASAETTVAREPAFAIAATIAAFAVATAEAAFTRTACRLVVAP